MVILVNGEETRTVDVLDRGLHYGDGLFETIAVVNGRPRLWQAHMARLAEGCVRLGFPQPDPLLLEQEASRALAGRERAILKLVLSCGPGGRGYCRPVQIAPTRILFVSPPPNYPSHFYLKGIEVRLCRTRLGHSPALAGIKHLNRLEQVLARSEWDDPDVPEGLMLDLEGAVAEGTMSNLFIRRGNRLRTPPVDRCGVAGVMRKWVMEHGSELGLDIEVTRLSLAEVYKADELFFTNALIGIWPVRRFETTMYPEQTIAGRLNRMLAEEFDA
jgi:4-amino-4-deoxychorismate lyase